jgi:hypothetical protein
MHKKVIDQRYTASQGEIKLAKYLGKKRCDAKPIKIRFNDSNYHSHNSKREYSHQLGALCEIAYCSITNQEVDLSIYEHGDSVDYNGVEVKGSTWPYEDIELKVKKSEYERKKLLVEHYVLCRVDPEFKWVEFIGSITQKKFDEIKYAKTHLQRENWTTVAQNMDGSIVYYDELKRPTHLEIKGKEEKKLN